MTDFNHRQGELMRRARTALENVEDRGAPVGDIPIEEMAPPNEEWHQMYAVLHEQLAVGLRELMEHPGFELAEDLGDWVDMMSTLTSFHPHTRRDFHMRARGEI